MSIVELCPSRNPLAVPTALPASGSAAGSDVRVSCRNVTIYYRDKRAIDDVDIDIRPREVMALIGPSGCGKSTLLRALNRMNDHIPGCRCEGVVTLNGEDIRNPAMDVALLRARIGMVFQRPNPFPKSIFDNVALGPRLHGLADSKTELHGIVEEALSRAGLWNEVKDRLHHPGTRLSWGQQQRLCIARALAVDPEIILMDEPCSALDAVATAWIERVVDELRKQISIVFVTHSMQQAARVSQWTAFFHLGKLIELAPTTQFFTRPEQPLTERYITGKFA